MLKRVVRKAAAAALVVWLVLVGLEIGVRLWGYSEPHMHDPIYAPFAQSEDIPYVYKANLVGARARGLAIINTDDRGLRTKTPGVSYGAKSSNEYRIAIVGDSITFGEGVRRTEDTYAQILEDRLNEQQGKVVRVLNFGASAYSVKQMAASLEHRMVEVEPDLVVLSIIPEDLNLSRTPDIDVAGYLVDKRVSFLHNGVIRDVLRPIRLMYVLRDIVLPYLAPSREASISELLRQDHIPESYQYVKRFRATAEQRGIPYVVVLLPKTVPDSWGSLPARLTHDGIAYLDLSAIVREFSTEEFVTSRFDRHPSAAVHRRIGELLANDIQRRPEFAR